MGSDHSFGTGVSCTTSTPFIDRMPFGMAPSSLMSTLYPSLTNRSTTSLQTDGSFCMWMVPMSASLLNWSNIDSVRQTVPGINGSEDIVFRVWNKETVGMKIGIHQLVRGVPESDIVCSFALFLRHVIVQMNNETIAGLDTEGRSTHLRNVVFTSFPRGVASRITNNVGFKTTSRRLGRAKVGSAECFSRWTNVE